MALDTWLAFAALWLTFAMIPGPSALFCVSTAIGVGTPRAYGAPAGIAIGSIVHVLVAAFGVGAVLMASADLFGFLKWVGVVYLVYLGVRQWRAALSFGSRPPARKLPLVRVVGEELLVMLTNPKAIFGYAAVLPLFIDPGASLLGQILVLAATTTAIAFVVNAGM